MPEQPTISSAQLRPLQAQPPGAEDASHRAEAVRRLIEIGAILALISIGSYLVLYAQTGAWQVLVDVIGLVGSLLCLAASHRLARQLKLEAAGNWIVAAVLLTYGAGELVWDDATTPLMISVILLLAFVGMALRPRNWRLWVGAFIGYGVYVFLVNQVKPLARYPILDVSPATQLINIPLALLVVWQMARYLAQSSLRARLLLSFVIVTLVAAAIVGAALAYYSAQMQVQQMVEHLGAVATLKETEISIWAEALQTDLSVALSAENVVLRARRLLNADASAESPLSTFSSYQNLREQFEQLIKMTGRLDALFLVNREGRAILSTDAALEGRVFGDEAFFLQGQGGPYLQPLRYVPALDAITVVVARPVLDESGQAVGVLAGRANMASLNAIMQERAGLGATGEIYLVGADYTLLTETRFEGYTPGVTLIRTQGTVRAVTDRASGSSRYDDYRGVYVVGDYRWLPDLQVALVTEQDEREASTALFAAQQVGFALTSVAIVIAVIASLYLTRSLSRPLTELAQVTQRAATGDLDLTIALNRRDEIGALAQSFNMMTAQLRDLIGSLEDRVEERTRDLETVAELSRAVTSVRDVERLLPFAVDLIQQRTDFYHVQVFLIDPETSDAVLRASTGEVGRRLLEAGHRLAVGSDSVIGQVTARGEPVIALDTAGAQVIHRPNPLLPDTRSEMALPLRIENRVIGALDVQSLEPDAFDENDVRVFQLLADQLATAIENAALLSESEARLREIAALNRRLVGEAWRTHLRARYGAALGAEAHEHRVVPNPTLTPHMAEAITSRQPVVKADDGSLVVALPVVYRETTLGALEFEVEGDAVDADTLALAQALADRLALSMDNVRLTERSQRMAQRERIVNEISGKITGKTDIEEVLQTAVRELGQALRVSATSIRLTPTRGHDGDADNGAEA
mgnify:CR=1 FL=1